MRLAKGFFLPLIAAGMRSKFCRPASPAGSGGVRTEVLQDAFYEYKFIFTLFNPRRILNSRMRLAKGFFLPLIAAGMRSKFCRPASAGVRPEVGRRFSEMRFVNINSFFILLIRGEYEIPRCD